MSRIDLSDDVAYLKSQLLYVLNTWDVLPDK
jgi:hypothetical protein